ncbi:hypothetical protein V8F44DRAFT_601194, partial [Aspergillus fumigatus]
MQPLTEAGLAEEKDAAGARIGRAESGGVDTLCAIIPPTLEMVGLTSRSFSRCWM